MTPLAKILKTQIEQHGPVTVAEFMSLALSHPKYGYYTSGNPLGKQGDFVTAPEVSQMFGEMIGAWCADIWIKLGQPTKLHLVELGAGRGTLMSDLLRMAQNIPEFYGALDVHIVDIGEKLIATQKEALQGHKNISWAPELSEISFEAPVIIVANEFLDALPVHQYQKTQNGWAERVIAFDSGREFHFGLKEVPFDLGQAETGKIKEVSAAQQNLVREVCDILKANTGVALFVDYGSLKSGFGDTLQAIKRHGYCDPFDQIGEADITTHIDFECLKKIACQEGGCISYLTTQRSFLVSLGILQRAQILKDIAKESQKTQIEHALSRLIGADQMGDLFKVMALSHSKDLQPEGFNNVENT